MNIYHIKGSIPKDKDKLSSNWKVKIDLIEQQGTRNSVYSNLSFFKKNKIINNLPTSSKGHAR